MCCFEIKIRHESLKLHKSSDLILIGSIETSFVWPSQPAPLFLRNFLDCTTGADVCVLCTKWYIGYGVEGFEPLQIQSVGFSLLDLVECTLYITWASMIKVAFFRKCDVFFKSPNLPKKIFQITLLNLKFNLPIAVNN